MRWILRPARLVLAHYNLRERNAALHETDERLIQHLRRHGDWLRMAR